MNEFHRCLLMIIDSLSFEYANTFGVELNNFF
jgi:hypothetical protein